MKQILGLYVIAIFSLCGCSSDGDNTAVSSQVSPTFTFTHNWDGELVTNANFNSFDFTTENGDVLSIERLRYVISDITFTTLSNENLVLNGHNLVDVTNANNLSYSTQSTIPAGSYFVSFTFGLDNEANANNYIDLNTELFNVPENLGGGYHYMQFDGKFINSNLEEQGFNYHAIRAVDNPGPNPTFPQDTFFKVNLGVIEITNTSEIEVEMNIAEWFRNPVLWDLNEFNQALMPNSTAQIMMYRNGQNVFSLGDVTQ
jgi:hypothetical protein